MKRLIATALAAVALVTLASGIAEAAKFSQVTPLLWRNLNSSNTGDTRVRNDQDTLWVTFGASEVETTATFSTEGWYTPTTNIAATDTCIVGTLWIQCDSTTATAVAATSLTIVPQWRLPGDIDLNWTAGTSVTFTDITTTDYAIKIPIYWPSPSQVLQRGTFATAGWPAPRMRFLITANGGAINAARAWLQNLIPDGEVRGR